VPITSIQLERPYKNTFRCEVKKAILHGRDVIIKRLWKQGMIPTEIKSLKDEIATLRVLAHVNVDMIRAACLQSPNVSLITEYEPFGSLSNLLHHETIEMDPFTSIKICQGIAEGMDFLHEKEIKHYNLKSSNVLVCDCRVYGRCHPN
jgi:serine/threonine protein kinase